MPMLPADPIDPNRRTEALGLDAYPSSFGDVMGATAEEAWATNPTVSAWQLMRTGAREPGPVGLGAEFGREALGPDIAPERMLTVEEANERYGIKGKDDKESLKFKEAVPESTARDFYEAKRKELFRRDVLVRSEGGIGEMAASLGVGLGVSVLDPINVASAFIPVVGPTRYAMALERAGASAAARAAARARLGAVEGAVGAAIVEPLVLAATAERDADYDALDSLLNIAFGTVLGGGLHAGLGAIGDRIAQARLQEPAMRGAVAAVVEDRPVRLDTIIPDEVLRGAVETPRADIALGAAGGRAPESGSGDLTVRAPDEASWTAGVSRAWLDDAYRARDELQPKNFRSVEAVGDYQTGFEAALEGLTLEGESSGAYRRGYEAAQRWTAEHPMPPKAGAAEASPPAQTAGVTAADIDRDIAEASRLGLTKDQMLANLAEREQRARADIEKAQDGLRRQDEKMYGAYWRGQIDKGNAALATIAAMRARIEPAAPRQQPPRRPAESDITALPPDDVAMIRGADALAARVPDADINTPEAAQKALDEVMAQIEALDPAQAAAMRAEGEARPSGPEATRAAEAQPVPFEPGANLVDPSTGARARMVEFSGPEIEDIQVDAKRFQFKAGGDEQGVSERLQGVETFDPILAGDILVWEQADGQMFVADGHQRVGLAKRLMDQNPVLRGTLLRETDGITAEKARAIAGLKNIAQGTGTAIDAAKLMRGILQNPELRAELPNMPPLPPRSALVRDAEGLARLGDDAFGMVVNEIVDPAYAAHVGRLIADPVEQKAALDVLAKVKPVSTAEALSIVRDLREQGFERGAEASLFGEQDIAQGLYLERARVLAEAARQLRRDKAVFRTLVDESGRITEAGNQLARDANFARMSDDERLAFAISTLANRKGPVSDALSARARELQSGAARAAAGRGFLDDVRARLQAGLELGEAGAAGRPAAESAADGQSGPRAEDQTGSVDQRTTFSLRREQADITDAPEFKAWFGDSKVVDESGKPLVVYHGSNRRFGVFERRPAMRNEDGRPVQIEPQAFFFATDEATARMFARDRVGIDRRLRGGPGGRAEVRPFYLSIKQPLDFIIDDVTARQIDEEGKYFVRFDEPNPYAAEEIADIAGFQPETWPDVQRALDDPNVVAELRARGYDGVHLFEEGAGESWAVFEPTQIKSTANRGTFDPNDPRISYRLPGEADAPATLRPDFRAAYPEKVETALMSRMKQVGIADRIMLKVVKDIRNRVDGTLTTAEGAFYDRIIEVALTSRDTGWTLNHEIVHGLRSLKLFKEAEWEKLAQAARADKLADGRARIDEIKNRYKDQALTDEQIVEESVADMFADWSAKRTEATGFLKTLFEKIAALFNALRAGFSDAGYKTLDDIFEGVERGYVGRRDAATAPSSDQPIRFAVRDDEPPSLFPTTETIDTADGPMDQYVLPGGERISRRELLERQYQQPKRATKPQQQPGGLFGGPERQAPEQMDLLRAADENIKKAEQDANAIVQAGFCLSRRGG